MSKIKMNHTGIITPCQADFVCLLCLRQPGGALFEKTAPLAAPQKLFIKGGHFREIARPITKIVA
jgi:hypothetical protein